MIVKIVRYTTCLIFFLLMLASSVGERSVWTSISFLTGVVMAIDEKTICQYFKVKNYWLFYVVWIFVALTIMVVAFYFELKGHNF